MKEKKGGGEETHADREMLTDIDIGFIIRKFSTF